MEAQPSHVFDLLIVGGGINGAAVARDAAGRGLSVCLIEAGDPGGATSWSSSKLIHGGLRYLEHFAFRLVRESLAERSIMLRIAPHLTRPCRFVLPHMPGMRPTWLVRLGLWLYDHLGGEHGNSLPAATSVRLDDGSSWGAPLKPGAKNGFIYFDVQVDDARLVIMTLRDAALRGADIHVGTRLLGASRVGGLWHARVQQESHSSGECHEIHARAIVNTAGPWVAKVLDTITTNTTSHPQVQLVRGSHIVVPRCYEGDHAYTLQNPDGRVVFLLPFLDKWTLIGTTDVRADEPSHIPVASDEEIDYLCAAASRYLAKPVIHAQIVWAFAGLRPLYDDGKNNPSAVTRDYKLVLDSAERTPLLSVFGGKLTTHRHLAESVLNKLSSYFPRLGDSWTADAPLPGGDCPLHDFTAATAEFFQAFHFLPEDTARGIWARHGTLAFDLLKEVVTADDLGRDFGGGLTEIEASYFIHHEWARGAEDILWRRSKAGLLMSQEQRSDFTHWFAEHAPRADAKPLRGRTA